MGSCKYYGVVSSMLDPPTIKLRIEFLAQNLIMHSIGIDFWPTLCQKQPSPEAAMLSQPIAPKFTHLPLSYSFCWYRT